MGSYRANIVVGADGFFSAVRKSLDRTCRHGEALLSVLCEVPLDEDEIYERYGDLLFVQYGFIDGGYAWIFPKRGTITAGIGGTVSDTKNLVAALKEFLLLHGLGGSAGIRGGYIPVSDPERPAYAERIMLAGDAAGFVDSFTGEGIRYAIASGRIAAQVAANCHTSGDFSLRAFSEYQKLCENRFGANLRYAARVKALFMEHAGLVLNIVVKNSDIMDRYLGTLSGETDYKTLVGWIKQRLPALLLRRIFTL